MRVANTSPRSAVPALAASVSSVSPANATAAAATSGLATASAPERVNGQKASAPSQSPRGPARSVGTIRPRFDAILAAMSPSACVPRGSAGLSARCRSWNQLRSWTRSQSWRPTTSHAGEPNERHL